MTLARRGDLIAHEPGALVFREPEDVVRHDDGPVAGANLVAREGLSAGLEARSSLPMSSPVDFAGSPASQHAFVVTSRRSPAPSELCHRTLRGERYVVDPSHAPGGGHGNTTISPRELKNFLDF